LEPTYQVRDDRNSRAVDIVRELWHNQTGILSTQVLQQFYAVTTRKLKRPRPTCRELVATYSEWCQVDTDPLLIVSASQLEEDHSLAFRDALIVEAALRSGAEILLSEDLQEGRTFGNRLIVCSPFS
jgi:predicted nucleic acid-binding protein